MKDSTLTFINKSIAAGIAIGIGGTAYLMTDNPIFFSIGLFIVCFYFLNLFTGKICYAGYAYYKDIKPLGYVAMWFLNTLSAYLTGLVIALSKPAVVEKAKGMVEMKLNEGLSIIPLAVLCNILIFIAVDMFKQCAVDEYSVFGIIGLMFATTIFVACGFEHCIANAFYFGVAGEFSIQGFQFLIVNAIFNAIGGIASFRFTQFARTGSYKQPES